MSKLQAFVRRNLTPILLLLLAGGYLVVVGELVLYRHWQGIQFIGFAASVVGLLCVLAGIFARGGLRLILSGILLVLSLSGLMGTFQHFEGNRGEGSAPPPALVEAPAGDYLAVAHRAGADLRQEKNEEEEAGEENRERSENGEAPPLAPLSLAGLSLMGAAILLAKQDQQARAG